MIPFVRGSPVRIYVDKGAIRDNEKLLESTPIGDKFGIFKKLKPPIVIELPQQAPRHSFEVEVLHAGEVVGKFVYDPTIKGGNTSVWFEIHCAELRIK